MVLGKPYYRRRRMNWSLLLLLALAFTPSAPSYSSQKTKAGAMAAPSNAPVEWDKFLIQGEPHPTLKIPVAHQHTSTGCLGYLYITREEIWYEVVVPIGD